MTYASNANPAFRSQFAVTIFNQKYRHEGAETWEELATTLVTHVCKRYMSIGDMTQLAQYIAEMKFIPGGRYLYYAGRPNAFFNNCYLLRCEEDTREDWANLSWKAESCLMTGGGIGSDYSVYRPAGALIARTGGAASGPIPKMQMINEIGRRVMQGGSRRSAIYASLSDQHDDVMDFLHCKDWNDMPVAGTNGLSIGDLKRADFNYPAPMDMTNISVNYGDVWLHHYQRTGEIGEVFLENVKQALKTAEPGFSFNFGKHANETLRNAPVSADTWVMTEDGYRQVGEIVNTPTILWTGKQWAEATFTKTGDNVPTVAVALTGGREIVADPTHEFFVERWEGAGKRRKLGKIEKVKAADLVPGDTLHVSLPTYDIGSDRDPILYTYGYAFGDGSFSKNYHNRAEITFCTDESKSCFAAMEGYPFKSVNLSDGRGFIRAYLVDDFFIGETKSRFPRLDHGLPSFIAGLFDADGSFDTRHNRVRLASVHKEFLEGARRALETLGIKSHINHGGRSTYGNKQGWMLVVASESITRFASVVPTVRLKVQPHKSYRASTIKVLSVIPDINQDVFCCDVGVDEHSFCAEGVILSNCTEVTSEDDSDVCNLGSLNLSRIKDINELKDVIRLATQFLICGTMEAKLPYAKVYQVREKNRRLGLGLMGVHEWLIQRGYRYEVVPELHDWLHVYESESDRVSADFADKLGVSRPVANRAIAPTGTIGIMAGTTTGIEPLFAVAYKRRYLVGGSEWRYQYEVDGTARALIEFYAADPDNIESAIDLASDYERRIAFQADVQDYVDMAISSTINIEPWGSATNNEDTVDGFAHTLARYAPRLRGFTCYPDGSRGGQPLTPVPYKEAISLQGQEFTEVFTDVCDLRGGGVCGV